METVTDFYVKLSKEIRDVYFPHEIHGITENKKYHNATYAMEQFNNGCLTYAKLIDKLCKNCNDVEVNIKKIVNKYLKS